MTKRIKVFLAVIFCFVLSVSLLMAAYAESEKTYYPSEKLLCISHRGDSAEFESNTPEAVLSAFEKGADYVSVNIRKNAQGKLVLCSENKSHINGVTLKEMISLLDENDILVLDFDMELKDEIYSFIETEDAFSQVIMRINDNAKNITEWLMGKNENLQVIGIYDSFVVFTAMSHIVTLSDKGMKLVQYQSKNYFNEMFGSLVSKKIKSDTDTRAIAATYNPDLCGQRSDSEDGWNDLIKKGYSVIETNNLNAFLSYIKSNTNTRYELKEALENAEIIETEIYNEVSRENLEDAVNTAKELLKSDIASSDELQSCLSALKLAIENLTLKTDDDTQKGALNVTAGKVIAALLVGAAILAAQIYTYKMQKGKKK